MARFMQFFHALLAALCLLGVGMGIEPVWFYWVGAAANGICIPFCEEAYGD